MGKEIITETKELVLHRNKTFKLMKGLLYIFPILGLTNNIYVYKYGFYLFNYKTCIDDLSIKSLFCVLVFALLYCAAYVSEKKLLPVLSALFIGKFKTEDFTISTARAHIFIGEKLNIDIFKVVRFVNENVDRLDLISKFMFIPVTFILWMLYINNILSYLAIITTIILMFFAFKLLNTLLYEPPTTP